jgi:hypothetical protein
MWINRNERGEATHNRRGVLLHSYSERDLTIIRDFLLIADEVIE